MAGRKPKPTAIKKLEGNPGKRKLNTKEPIPAKGIGDRQCVTFKRLHERYADMGQVGFLASKRVDGKLVLPEAVKVLQQKPGSSS